MTNSTVDGLGGDEVNQNVTLTDTISGTNIYASTLVTTKNLSVTGSIVANSKVLGPIGTGSPVNWNTTLLAGSNVTGAGSLVWVSYGQAFTVAPQVLVQVIGEQAGLATGSIGVGSFVTYSVGAAKNFTWIALG